MMRKSSRSGEVIITGSAVFLMMISNGFVGMNRKKYYLTKINYIV